MRVHTRSHAKADALAHRAERFVLLGAVAVGVLMFFRPTRIVGRVLLALWLVVAWPVAWLRRPQVASPHPRS